MTSARLWRVLFVVGVVVLSGPILAMAYYNDDGPDQAWQFELGIAVFRYGYIPFFVATAGALIWTLHDKRRPPRS